MARFRPSELQEYLHSIGAKPQKGLSQNFLIDGNILNKIVALADVSATDTVIEIGPGPGALTERLLETGCKVIAIEKDPIFAKALTTLDLRVITADVLDVDLTQFGKQVKVVANLPYNITTPILQKLLPLGEYITSITVMVQEEVARRLCFSCAPKDYVAFTLYLHYYSRPHYGFTVSPKCFYPAPKVHSSVMRLDLDKRYPVADEKAFFAYVDAAFSHRRKMLKATLKPWFSHEQVEMALSKIGKAPTSRPEELSLEEWVRFYSFTSQPQTT